MITCLNNLILTVYQLAQAALQLTGTGVGIANQASESAWFPVAVENAAKMNRDLQDRLLNRGGAGGAGGTPLGGGPAPGLPLLRMSVNIIQRRIYFYHLILLTKCGNLTINSMNLSFNKIKKVNVKEFLANLAALCNPIYCENN